MTDEKRKHPRRPLVMEALWDGASSRSQARTTDISAGGCFIDTLGQASIGETLNVRLVAPDGEYITVEGMVIYHLPHSGFGLRFTKISDSDRKRLEALINPEE